MDHLILISTIVSVSYSAAIHNHDQVHSTLYTQQQSPQHESQQLLTPLKLQYVAPKAFLTSAGLISGQQIIPTQNPQLISPTVQPVNNGNARQVIINPSQIIASSNPELISRNSQIVNSNLQQLLNSNVELLTQQKNNHNIQTGNQQFLSVLNPQYLTSINSEQVTARNQQFLAPNNPQLTPTVNPQYITGTNAPIITPRNPQIFTTISPVVSADNPQLIQSNPQQNTVSNSVIPLVYTIQSPVDNYSGQQRFNRLPATNNVIPELQFADPRSNGIVIPNAQIASLLNALYQPSYLLMTMPPTSYTAVNYYDDPENNPIQDTNSIQSDSIQEEVTDEDHIHNSKSNLVQRSSSDVSIESDSSSNYSEKQGKEGENADPFKLSYKDNHVKYSY